MIRSFCREVGFDNLNKMLFVVFLFLLSSCAKQDKLSNNLSGCLNPKEKEDLARFFQSLFFDDYGVYVLFGSKPICSSLVRDQESSKADFAFKKFLSELPQEERKKIEMHIEKAKRNARETHSEPFEFKKKADLENSCYRGWKVFQTFRERLKLNGFLFRTIPLPRPDAYEILFINIQQTALVLAENYDIFKQAAGMDFHPLQIVFEAEDLNSAFWNNVMSMENHMAKGLLFGFGRRNSQFGSWTFLDHGKSGHLVLPNEGYREKIEFFLKQSIMTISTDIVPKGNFSFNIPLFGAISGDETAEKYGKERSIIARKYHNQDMVDVTLKRLFIQPN